MSYGFGKLNEYAERVHETAKSKGFWDALGQVNGEQVDASDVGVRLSKLMLVTTEVAEAAEAVRHGDQENFGEELADIVIRVMDLAEATGVNLEQAIVNKMAVNVGRPLMHGKLA